MGISTRFIEFIVTLSAAVFMLSLLFPSEFGNGDQDD